MQNFKFKSFLDNIYREKQISKKNSIIKYEEIINTKINTVSQYKANKKNTFYMKYPSGEIYFGYGNTISIKINKKNDLKILKNNDYSILTNNDKVLNFFGGLSFDLDNKNYYPWNKIPKGKFIIPKVLIKQISGKTILTYFKKVNQKTRKSYIIHDFNKEFCSIKNIKSFKKDKTKINLEYQKPNKNDYLSNIQNIIKKINNKDLSKVVISRLSKYSLKENLNKGHLIEYLNRNHPNCFNFFINFNKDKSFIGSSPEKLIKLSNNTTLSIDALAGSSKKINDLRAIKEIDEHNYVIKHIKDIMSPICKKIYIPQKPETLNLKYIHHLITSIKGELKNKTHIIDLIKKLYPTPALLGFKSKKALQIINDIEKTDRGWYGGCIGNFDTNGNGDFFVPIRSCLQNHKKLFIFTGSGIISKSDATKEWEETQIKSKHILDYFKS
tara:strand:- start:4088 stop:5407 length:1320 start_codon:yes stop_codon:yes gene_type:complete